VAYRRVVLVGVFNPPPPPEIPKALQNIAKQPDCWKLLKISDSKMLGKKAVKLKNYLSSKFFYISNDKYSGCHHK